MTRREIINAALALPADERAAIVDELNASLDGAEATEGATVKADDKLLALIREREAAVRRGTATFSADEVFAELLGE